MFFCVPLLQFSSPSILYTDWMRFSSCYRVPDPFFASAPHTHTHFICARIHTQHLFSPHPRPAPAPVVDLNWVVGWVRQRHGFIVLMLRLPYLYVDKHYHNHIHAFRENKPYAGKEMCVYMRYYRDSVKAFKCMHTCTPTEIWECER